LNNIVKLTRSLGLLFSLGLGSLLLATASVYAAPTFQAAGTAVNGTGAVTPVWPAHQIDDIALLIVESDAAQAVTLSTPAGFTAVTNSPQTTGATGSRITVFWARANSSAMASPTVADPGDHVYAQIITYRGVINTGNPWDVTSGGNKATASTTVTVTGVTTTVADTLIVQIASRDLDSTAAAFSGQTNGNLTSITERVDAGTTSGNGGGFAVWDGTMATAGATGNTTATVTSSVNSFMTIALKTGVFCSPPANVPAGVTVTCVCDVFGRASLNPSTIYGGNWALSNSDGISNPYINGTTGFLRLTENTGSNAKAATVPSIFPAAGNYISVEFNHYGYNGSGADGIAITLSDYSIPAVPGGYGGSLGYAQRNDGTVPPGFAGGWVGVALDEFGNYQNPTEGRVLGPGFVTQSVGVRGPGSGANGYRWMGGTGSSPGGVTIDSAASTTPAPGYMYQVVVDARNSSTGTINVQVNRDSTTNNGTNYSTLFGPFNAYTEANYALSQGWITQIVPNYWKISFTGSTGGSTNIHEIGNLRICAQSSFPSTGGTASGFSAIDEAYPAAAGSTIPAYPNFSTGDIYMKLAGTSFKLWVAALTGSGISTAYSAVSNKFLQVKLVDNTDNACGTDAARTCNATCTNKTAVEAGTNATQIITMTNTDPGGKLSGSFQLNSAWKNLIAVIKECTTVACTAFTATAAACSVDSFSVRPPNITSVTSSNATNTGTTGTPIFKAGTDTFAMTAATGVTGYTGTPKINNATIQVIGGGAHVGSVSPTTFPAAATGTGATTGSTFTYDEVGVFRLPGFTDDTTPRGVYDGVQSATECAALTTIQCDALRALTWTGIDSITTEGDCIIDSYSNTKVGGKYGCNFGNTGNVTLGRFIPDHFTITGASIINRVDMGGGTGCSPGSGFTYMGEPMKVSFNLNAVNAGGTITQNYVGSYAKLSANTSAGWLAYGSNDSLGFWMNATNYTLNGSTCSVRFTNGTTTTYAFCSGAVPSTVTRAAGSRVTVVAGTASTPSWVTGTSAFSANVILERADTADGAYNTLNLGIAPQDSDGVKMTSFNLDMDNDATNERALVISTDTRYGRMNIANGYGSEVLNLPVDMIAQYWNGTSYTTNTSDNCTLQTLGNYTMSNWTGGITSTNMNMGSNFSGSGTFSSGVGRITLLKPNPTPTTKGSVDLSTTGTLSTYLPGTGRESFGVYKAGPIIYIRENY
jgi:MSHA biogenesis protein MshQ